MPDPRHHALFAALFLALAADLPATLAIDGHAAALAQADDDDDDDGGDDGGDDDAGGGGDDDGGGGGGRDDDGGGGDDDGGGGGRGDDDDDDDDDDDRGGGGGARGDDDDDDDDMRPRRERAVNDDDAPAARRQRQEPSQQAQPRAAPPPAQVELPRRAPREILATGLSPADLETLVGQGFEVIEGTPVTRRGPLLHRLRAPAGLTLADARAAVRALPSGPSADFNHFYRTNQDIVPAAGETARPVPAPAAECAHLNCVARELVGWPELRPPTCQARITIGVIDTGVNVEHPALPPGKVELVRLADPDLPDSSATHGTSVLSMLIGTEPRAPGLIPEAQVLAVDVFSRQNGDERTDAATLIRAIDLLSQRGVRVANLSLAGPPNSVLADMLREVEAKGMLVIAAAGNGGPAARPAWPAASRVVLAVTAVDPFGRIYRRAQRGEHLDVAAPGVDIWAAASIRGVRSRTGTSYATPWATAAAALLMAQDPELTPAEAIQRLRALTADAGAEGPDAVFGEGVLALQALCADAAVPAE